MKTTTNAARTRKTIEERLEEMRARLEGLAKRKAEQDRRDLQRLKLRLGAAAVAAGFTADWTDAQLERAMTVAAKSREGAGKPVVTKVDAESAKAPAPAGAAAVAKPYLTQFKGQ